MDERRKLSDEAKKDIASARIYTASDALRLGLVDRIGYLDDAILETIRMAGLPEDARVVVYRRSEYADDNFYNTSSSKRGMPDINLIQLDLVESIPPFRSGFYYLWLRGNPTDHIMKTFGVFPVSFLKSTFSHSSLAGLATFTNRFFSGFAFFEFLENELSFRTWDGDKRTGILYFNVFNHTSSGSGLFLDKRQKVFFCRFRVFPSGNEEARFALFPNMRLTFHILFLVLMGVIFR